MPSGSLESEAKRKHQGGGLGLALRGLRRRGNGTRKSGTVLMIQGG